MVYGPQSVDLCTLSDIESEIKGNAKAKEAIHTGFTQKREKPRSNEKRSQDPGKRLSQPE